MRMDVETRKKILKGLGKDPSLALVPTKTEVFLQAIGEAEAVAEKLETIEGCREVAARVTAEAVRVLGQRNSGEFINDSKNVIMMIKELIKWSESGAERAVDEMGKRVEAVMVAMEDVGKEKEVLKKENREIREKLRVLGERVREEEERGAE